MGQITKIGWTDHTFNIVWGCVRVSEGCEHCYAEEWAARLGFAIWGPTASRRVFGEDHWNEPLKWNRLAEKAGQRRRVFCSSMADVFEDHPTVAEERKKLWPLIEATPWLDWQLLTKRPGNVDEAMPDHWRGKWPKNVWLGFTGENQRRFEQRWPIVEWLGRQNHIQILFCSAEPLLGPLDLEIALHAGGGEDEPQLRTIDWVIVGGESGKKARPFEVNWVGAILVQLDALEIPVFVKQFGSKPTLLGRPMELKHPKGEDPSEWPCVYNRQELPMP